MHGHDHDLTSRASIPQATSTSSTSPTASLIYNELFNDTSLVNAYTGGDGEAPVTFPGIPAFKPYAAVTSAPLYSLLINKSLAFPSGSTCGPSGYGFGCALALALGASTPTATLGNGKPSGPGNVLSALSAGTPQSGMCVTNNTAPMPRPPNAAEPQAMIQMLFFMNNNTIEEVINRVREG